MNGLLFFRGMHAHMTYKYHWVRGYEYVCTMHAWHELTLEQRYDVSINTMRFLA